jgi:hypothetical protein
LASAIGAASFQSTKGKDINPDFYERESSGRPWVIGSFFVLTKYFRNPRNPTDFPLG